MNCATREDENVAGGKRFSLPVAAKPEKNEMMKTARMAKVSMVIKMTIVTIMFKVTDTTC